MGSSIGPKVTTDGLIFAFDQNNNKKSWKGKPTTNFAHSRNPRIDSSYDAFTYNPGGSYNILHPGRIRVYSQSGAELSQFVNSGVGDYTNKIHAYWVYDDTLKKPVVVMRDKDASWKAIHFGLADDLLTTLGGHGATYTISWLQKTTNISKTVNAGLYNTNTSGSNGFHDGMSNTKGSTAFNTKVNTWQRLYATFTVNASRALTGWVNCYFYGHYNTRDTLWVSDVQVEAGTGSGFSFSETRSSTEALIDMTGNNTITATNLDYQSDGSFDFGASKSCHIDGTFGEQKGNMTMMAWVDQGSRNGPHQTVMCTHINHQTGMKLMSAYHGNGPTMWVANSNGTSSTLISAGAANTIEGSGISHIAATRNTSTGAIKVYVNGALKTSGTGVTGDINTPVSNAAKLGVEYHSGSYGLNAKVHSGKAYNRVLSDNEIKDIYEAHRASYGV